MSDTSIFTPEFWTGVISLLSIILNGVFGYVAWRARQKATSAESEARNTSALIGAVTTLAENIKTANEAASEDRNDFKRIVEANATAKRDLVSAVDSNTQALAAQTKSISAMGTQVETNTTAVGTNTTTLGDVLSAVKDFERRMGHVEAAVKEHLGEERVVALIERTRSATVQAFADLVSTLLNSVQPPAPTVPPADIPADTPAPSPAEPPADPPTEKPSEEQPAA